MKKINLLLLSFILSAFIALGQNPTVVNGVATYHSNINIGKKFQIPETWNKIIINANVTVTGSFYMPTRSKPIEIMGQNRKTSIIQGDGSRPTDDGINGRSYSAIRADKSPDIYVHDLTVTKPMKFHIHGGFGNVTVERCDIVAGSYTHTTDGIHGGVGKTVVKDCYINCYDDALYTIECKLVEKTTIVHNKNGGPFMTSWGNDVPNGNVCVIRNCTVIAGHTGTDYNHGVVSWAGKSSASNVKETNTLKFEGTFEYIVPTGKKASTFYTIGRPNDSGINNAHIVIDGQCPYKNSINLRSSTNSSVTFKNCETAPISYTLTVNSGTGSGNLTAQSTKTITANVAPSGKVFDKWVVNSGNPSIANATDASTILTMPAGNATVTATYKDISINITPTDITNLSARAVSCNSVELTWGDVQGEEAYRVRRKTPTSDYIILADLPADASNYTDLSVLPDSTYIYMVRPMQGGVAVKTSNTPQVTISACQPEIILPVNSFENVDANQILSEIKLVKTIAYDGNYGTTHGAGIKQVNYQIFDANDLSTALDFFTITVAPYYWSLNTENYPNGDYQIRSGAVSLDAGETKWVVSNVKIQNTITNLESGESNSGISIYPNPTSDVININYPDSGFTWELRNTDGQLLKTGEEKSIELVNEPSGIYFLKIGNNVFKVSKK